MSKSASASLILIFSQLSCIFTLSELKAADPIEVMPITNKNVNNYKQFFSLSSISSQSSSGNSDAFINQTTVEIKPVATMEEPLNVTDSFSVKGGSVSTSISVSKFFPADENSTSNISDSALVDKFKDLSQVTLNLDVKPKELTNEQKKLVVLNADFNAVASTKLEIYTEASSPTFVSSFQDVLFNKKMITR